MPMRDAIESVAELYSVLDEVQSGLGAKRSPTIVDATIRKLYASAAALILTAEARKVLGPKIVQRAVAAARQIRPYTFRDSFLAGEVIAHPKYGHGIVRRCYRSGETGRIDVLFADADRTMLSAPPTVSDDS